MNSIQKMFENLTPKQRKVFLSTLPEKEALAILDCWELWAMPHQLAPEGDWRRWICRAGRGSGKTHAGAKTVNEIAQDLDKIQGGNIGIIAQTWNVARKSCVEGSSGIIATAPDNFKPLWEPGKKQLTWPNGVIGHVYSADKPESLRSSNWSFVWADEVAFWRDAEKTWWEVIEPALRIGWSRAVITTTPLPDPFLRKLEAQKDSVLTRGSTYDNKFLSEAARNSFINNYAGTRRERQELYGEYLEDNLSAIWTQRVLEDYRIDPDEFDYDCLVKIVVAVDPAVTVSEDSDETGIIVAGMDKDGHAYVLEDHSGKYHPTEWANLVVDTYHNWKANYIVAEVNQGGQLVESNIRQVDNRVAYKAVRAKLAKALRAEPVGTAYEKGRVSHVGKFPKLETQQTEWEPGKPSPDRLDALVYAITELIIESPPPKNWKQINTGLNSLGRSWR